MKLSDLMTGETIENNERIKKLEKEIKLLKHEKTNARLEEREIRGENLRVILYIAIIIMMIIELLAICIDF